MSVLIKGMEMPKSCGKCGLCLQVKDLCAYCMATGLQIKYSETDLRDGMCPLVEVDETDILDGWDNVYPDDDEVEPRYCDRNICASNEVNGIGCDECPVMMDEVEE